MFVEGQDQNNRDYYEKMLKLIGSLSGLFSDNISPYLDSRIAENLFCKSFKAQNMARDDKSFDAMKDGVGIGIKTFLCKNDESFEKIAEFNRLSKLFRGLEPEDMVRKVAELRNDRVSTDARLYGTEDSIYHCIVRRPNKILAFETPMHLVDLDAIQNIRVNSNGNIIDFEDGICKYKFNVTKSVLQRKFKAENFVLELTVTGVDDPFSVLEGLIPEVTTSPTIAQEDYVVLPLYSYERITKVKYVPERSGLNQWNADGRIRHNNEVYIPVPAEVHRLAPAFFPPGTADHFKLVLPKGTEIEAKLCQAGDKALMSKHNKDLGEWMLRDFFGFSEWQLVSYKMLEDKGTDSVLIKKIEGGKYSIEFLPVGSYESFVEGTFQVE